MIQEFSGLPALRLFLLGGLLFLCAQVVRALNQPAAPVPPVERFLRKAAAVMTDITPQGGRVYFPAVATDPNAGPTYGAMPIWLWSDPQRGIRHILAPSLTYNSTFGATGTGRYYFYPDARSRLFVIGSKSARSDYRAAARYEDVGFQDGRCILKLEGNHEAQGALRFFGFGPASPESGQTGYRLLEETAAASLGIRYFGVWQFVGAWRFRYTQVQPGAVETVPPISPAFQQKTRLSLPRFSMVRDTRDTPATPTKGTWTELFAEFSDTSLGSDATYQHYSAQWRGYIPTTSDRHVLGVRGLLEETQGDVPFTSLLGLGGAHELRGFGEGRFLDRGRMVFNLEDRWTAYRLELVNAVTEFQLAPFVDVGTVFDDLNTVQFRYLHPVGGVAFRAVVKPTVVGTIDLGFGQEGSALFVGVDYPF